MTGFAARFSDLQRSALRSLGYPLLEQRPAANAPDADDPLPDTTAARTAEPLSPRERGWGEGAPKLQHGESRSSPPTVAPAQDAGAPARSGPTPARAAQARLPARVIVDGFDAGTPLGRGILAALAACAPADDPRVTRNAAVVDIALGGPGENWCVHLDALRSSPKRKAALWRALRTLRRETTQ